MKAWREANREKHNAISRAYHEANREKVKARNKAWQKANPEKKKASDAAWREANPDKVKANVAAWEKAFRATPQGKMVYCLRTRLRLALKSRYLTAACSKRYVGCTRDELVAHLEAQFQEGMTWENHGTYWHVDHIRPIASFSDEELAAGVPNHYLNLQPLTAEENMKKGAKWAGQLAEAK